MSSLFDTLQQRGFVEQSTHPELSKWLDEKPRTLYAGFDPTADSLHLGHMVPILALAHFQRAGHKALVVVGGATGMVGDPSGRSTERSLLTIEQVRHNAQCIKRQMERFLRFEGEGAALLLDNHDWIGPLSFIDWLRDVGKHFNIRYMLDKESVKKRLDSESGLSYTEFSYMTMQAYDFLHLHRAHKCDLQIGGSDQWGNILAGTELIRKVTGGDSQGMTLPLMTTSTGEKFGKSAGNAVWLDPKRTSPYQFYQYWVRTDDRDVARFLKIFTFLPLEELAGILAEHEASRDKRIAQKRLAHEMTKLIHGEAEVAKVERATEVLFGREIEGLSDAELADIFADVPSVAQPRATLDAGIRAADLAAAAGLAPSKGEAKRLVSGGGFYINNRRVTDPGLMITAEHLASEHVIVLRSGKKEYRLVRFE